MLCHASYNNLFYLCVQGAVPGRYLFVMFVCQSLYICNIVDDERSCHMLIARQVVPLLISRCKEVLQRMIGDDKKIGSLPLPRWQLAEANFVLKQLLLLDLHPDISEDSTDSNKGSNVKINAKITGKKRHLLLLFPLFSDCITVKEPEIKEQLKEIFHAVARELGIE